MFYKHPPSEAYGLNKLLFESRHSARPARAASSTTSRTSRDEYDLQRHSSARPPSR